MAIQLCPVDTANVHPRNILGSSSSFDRERLSPFGSLSSRCWETVVYITLSSGPAQPGCQPCQKGDAFQHSQNSARRSITPLCQNRGPASGGGRTLRALRPGLPAGAGPPRRQARPGPAATTTQARQLRLPPAGRPGLPAPGCRGIGGVLHPHRRTLRTPVPGHHVQPLSGASMQSTPTKPLPSSN